jgi:PTH1 family peptidyl-tRNA hydrolase
VKLIVGLGNIGVPYARTRHNIGFMVIDQLAHDLTTDPWKSESKFKAEITRSGNNLLLKPHTMMNLSGDAAQKVMQFYKITPQQVWAVFDDVDVPFGKLRLRTGGGTSGGHQGINSLIRHIGPNFVRARVGISLNDRTRESSEEYVLKPFNPQERQQLPGLIDRAASIIATQIKLDQPEDTTFDLLD